MWCILRRPAHRYLISALGGLAILMSGCGFRPLYKTGGGSDAAVLATVEVARIKDRIGQQLRNQLMAGLAPRGPAARLAYRLTVTLTESKVTLAIKKDETATRANLTINAQFTLVALNNPQFKDFRGSALSTNSYNILTSDFATLSSKNDARNRALRTLAEEIRLRVAAALNSQNSSSNQPAGQIVQ